LPSSGSLFSDSSSTTSATVSRASLSARAKTQKPFRVYFAGAIVNKRLHPPASLHEIPQILSLTPFEKTPLDQLLEHMISDQIQPVSTTN
jgi:hypothetical protein